MTPDTEAKLLEDLGFIKGSLGALDKKLDVHCKDAVDYDDKQDKRIDKLESNQNRALAGLTIFSVMATIGWHKVTKWMGW